MTWSNWSGSVTCEPQQRLYPHSTEELATLVQAARNNGQTVRVYGSGHSFVPLMQTNQILVSLDNMQGIIDVNREKHEVTVKAGTKIKKLTQALYEIGYAPENLGDIDVQSIAGAISTGTHGTGANLPSISNQVVALKLVTGTGEIVSLSGDEQGDLFKAAQVSLGALGIITELTLRCLPSYKLHLRWFKSTLKDCLANYERYCQENRHFEFFWIPHTDTVMVKFMNMTNDNPKASNWFRHFNEVVVENTLLGLMLDVTKMLPQQSKTVAKVMAGSVTGGEDVQYAHNVFATERGVRFQEMEYNVPVTHFPDVIREIDDQFKHNHLPVAFPIECRFVRRDDVYLSPAYERDAAYIAVHEYYKKPYQAYFDLIEPIFDRYQGRPHWGKMHSKTDEDFAALYPKFADFLAIRDQFDPDRVLTNDYLAQILGD